ncbi:hypothetical protein [Thalassomonas haliotis]|uniref:DUF8038 domain-containing protein n=1 Tax=Thalassomonas haliotis TaxID=485448 RepID=A0ABY7VMK7_9GAMM|nr:hypothetical protein [Thalassomonas haliotis]WDE14215.1 hypothetical protein H3N35_12835 [Thalassomonas haliotis]
MKKVKQKRLVNARAGVLLAMLAGNVVVVNANAGVFDACFGGGGYKPVSEEKMAARLDKISLGPGGVCYDSALCMSVAEKALTSEEVASVRSVIRDNTPKGTTEYPPEYLELMNINDQNTYSAIGENNASPNSINLNDINESGFLNFKKNGEGYGHTAYIQVTKDGDKFLYNWNQPQLDLGMMSASTGTPVSIPGKAIRWQLTDETVQGFNKFLSGAVDKAGNATLPADFHWEFNYTPYEQVTENLAHGSNAL